MKRVNLGIIGLGRQGKIHLRNALRLKEVKVYGVADVSGKALAYAKKFGVKKIYKDYQNLLEDEQLDAVVISLPNFLHLEGAVKAAEAGKHIFLEKPLARNVAEGEKILSALEKNDVKLMINYPLRFDSVLKKIREEIAEGFFGEVEIVDATNVSGGPFTPKSDKIGAIPVPVSVPSWWFNKELTGGGALLDLGSHMIDLLSWYFGEADVLKSYLGYMFNMEFEDTAVCMLKFKDGPVANVKVGWFSKDRMCSIQLCGTTKNVWVSISPKSSLKIVWKDFRRKLFRHSSDSFYLALEHFVKCLQNDEEPHPSGEEGLQGLRVVSQAYEKARKQ